MAERHKMETPRRVFERSRKPKRQNDLERQERIERILKERPWEKRENANRP